jgi:hypothetical protein
MYAECMQDAVRTCMHACMPRADVSHTCRADVSHHNMLWWAPPVSFTELLLALSLKLHQPWCSGVATTQQSVATPQAHLLAPSSLKACASCGTWLYSSSLPRVRRKEQQLCCTLRTSSHPAAGTSADVSLAALCWYVTGLGSHSCCTCQPSWTSCSVELQWQGNIYTYWWCEVSSADVLAGLSRARDAAARDGAQVSVSIPAGCIS